MSEPTQDEIEMRRKLDELLVRRLDGIESELRAMRELLVKSAQLEERMVRLAETGSRTEGQLAGILSRLSLLETTGASGKEKVSNVERALWASITFMTAIVVGWFRSKP